MNTVEGRLWAAVRHAAMRTAWAGFTLIEMMVVILIIGNTAGAAIPLMQTRMGKVNSPGGSRLLRVNLDCICRREPSEAESCGRQS